MGTRFDEMRTTSSLSTSFDGEFDELEIPGRFGSAIGPGVGFGFLFGSPRRPD
jgi:hypothetical protein